MIRRRHARSREKEQISRNYCGGGISRRGWVGAVWEIHPAGGSSCDIGHGWCVSLVATKTRKEGRKEGRRIWRSSFLSLELFLSGGGGRERARTHTHTRHIFLLFMQEDTCLSCALTCQFTDNNAYTHLFFRPTHCHRWSVGGIVAWLAFCSNRHNNTEKATDDTPTPIYSTKEASRRTNFVILCTSTTVSGSSSNAGVWLRLSASMRQIFH